MIPSPSLWPISCQQKASGVNCPPSLLSVWQWKKIWRLVLAWRGSLVRPEAGLAGKACQHYTALLHTFRQDSAENGQTDHILLDVGKPKPHLQDRPHVQHILVQVWNFLFFWGKKKLGVVLNHCGDMENSEIFTIGTNFLGRHPYSDFLLAWSVAVCKRNQWREHRMGQWKFSPANDYYCECSILNSQILASTVEFPLVDTPPMWTLLLNGHFLPGPFIFLIQSCLMDVH